jgi:thiol-disulfide isomerase/thioredoxin
MASVSADVRRPRSNLQRPPMTRLAESVRRHPLALTVTAASLILLLIVGLEYGPELGVGEPTVRQSRPIAPPAADDATDPQKISIVDPPRPLPQLAFTDGDGRPLSLADFHGRVVLLNLWATWCVPCRKEMPTLDRLQAKLGGDRFIVIPLSIDRGGTATVKGFYQQVGVKRLGIYLDPSSRVPSLLAAPGVPTTLLIDGRGREVALKLGEAEWDGPQMTDVIRHVIDSEPAR